MIGWIRSKLRCEPEPARCLEQAENAYQRGALDEARHSCLEILRSSPSDVRALCLLASIAADAKQIDDGMQWARKALAVEPRAAVPHYAMGRLWETAGRYADAEASYRTAVSLDPSHAKAHNNLGAVLHMQGKMDAALTCYRKALELDPAQPQANQNYAAFVRDPDAQELAIQGYLRQIADNPGDAAALNNLANTYVDLGRHEEALSCLERCIALEPGRAEAHFSKAFMLLLRGDYAAGWKEYEWRWRIDAFNAGAQRFPQPLWDGRRLPGGTVLIHGESGFGDMLQFVRYAPLVAERCAAVVLECQPALVPLLQGFDGVRQVVAQGAPLPPFAAHVPLIMLPGIFRTTLQSVPWRGPYVHADAKRIAEWRALVASGDRTRLKVGLVWAGDPANWGDRKRSITLAMLAPLARVSGAMFYSLQKGKPSAEASAPPAGMKFIDHTARIRDFADTAALMSLLDIVISIDTSVAHLAGAMGVPTWVLLAFSADWRFHLERSDNPWYPTMRLFRQPSDGDWAGAIDRLVDELRRQPVQSGWS